MQVTESLSDSSSPSWVLMVSIILYKFYLQLETEESLLVPHARAALQKYHHQVRRISQIYIVCLIVTFMGHALCTYVWYWLPSSLLLCITTTGRKLT